MLRGMTEPESLRVPVILWHPDGQRVAVQGQDLPVLEVKRNGDVSQAVKRAWGGEAWTLDDAGIPFGLTRTPRLRASVDELPTELHWVKKEIPPLPFEQVWQHPDWPERLKERLAGTALKVKGFSSLYSNDLVSIVRVQTRGGGAYLKTSSTPKEARFTEYVAGKFPHLCPPLLACNVNECWQVTASGGKLLDAVADLNAWQQAIQRLIEFQQSADAAALAGLGAPAYPFQEMPERIAALLKGTAVLQGWGLPTDKIQALQDAQPQIQRAFQKLAALNLPDLPAHGDAHVRNALHGERGSVWFDWSEAASAAHPFMDMGWFLAFALHPAREKLPIRQAEPQLEKKLTAAVLKALDLPEAAAPAVSAAIPLAYLHRAVVYDSKFRAWQGNLPGWRPNYVPYYLRQAVQELHRLPE